MLKWFLATLLTNWRHFSSFSDKSTFINLFYVLFLLVFSYNCWIFLFVSLGDFEVFLNYFSVFILGMVIFNIINCFSFRNLIKRFGFLKNSRRDFYECGFRPQTQKPIRLPIQFLLICVFFLMYDIELVFVFPYTSGVTINGLYDFILIVYFFLLFLLSLVVDYERHALYWQY